MLSTGTDEVENMPFDWMVGGEAITVLAPGSLVNSNSLFDSNITGWTATGCTAVHSTTFVHPDPQALGSMRIPPDRAGTTDRSEEHTSELQSLKRLSSAVFDLKKTHTHKTRT